MEPNNLCMSVCGRSKNHPIQRNVNEVSEAVDFWIWIIKVKESNGAIGVSNLQTRPSGPQKNLSVYV